MLLPGGWLMAIVALEEVADGVAAAVGVDAELVAALGVEPPAAGADAGPPAAALGVEPAAVAGAALEGAALAEPAAGAAPGEASPENAAATSEEDR